MERRPSLISRVPDWAARHPRAVILGVAVAAALAGLALPRLRLQAGIYELFPRRPGPIRGLAAYGRIFGARQELVVLVSGDDPARVARATRRFAAELARSAAVEEVRAGVQASALTGSLGRSLLLLAGPEAWPEIRRRLADPKPHVARLRRVLLSPVAPPREALLGDPLGLTEVLLLGGAGAGAEVDRDSGLFAAPGGRAALILARPRREASDLAFCRELDRELRGIARRVTAEERGVSVGFTGGHQYALYIASELKRDLTVSGLAALGGVVLFLLLFFRSLRLAPLAALIAGVAVLCTLALAVVLVGGLNSLSLAFAALCIGMGLDGLIHITARTRAFTAEGDALGSALRALAPALLAASLTTIAAFSTFGLSAFAGLAHTGLLAACGLGLTLLLTLLLIPALAGVSPRLSVPVQRAPAAPTLLDRTLAGLAGLVIRGRWPLLAAALALGGLALWAARGVTFSADLAGLAPAGIPPVKTDEAIARRFARGRSRVIVTLRAGDLQRALEANDRLAELLWRWRRAGRVAGQRTISGLLPARATQRRRRARLAALDPAAIERRLRAELEAAGLHAEAFTPFFRALTAPVTLTAAGLPDGLRPLVQRHLARDGDAHVVATILHPPPRATRAQVRALAAGVRRQLSSPRWRGVQVEVTGAALAGEQMARLLRRDLLLVSLLSLGVVLVVLGLLLRRVRPVLAATASLLFTGLAFAGLFAALGLEVNLYNLMVLPVLIGYGVDDHIYVVRRALADGVRIAVTESGRAVLATTLTSMAAFGALALCQVPGLRSLGLTAILGLGLALVGALVVMPALLSLGEGRGR